MFLQHLNTKYLQAAHAGMNNFLKWRQRNYSYRYRKEMKRIKEFGKNNEQIKKKILLQDYRCRNYILNSLIGMAYRFYLQPRCQYVLQRHHAKTFWVLCLMQTLPAITPQ